MTNGTLSAMILSDMILGNSNPYESFFDQHRRSNLKSIKNFLINNANITKEFIKGRIRKYEKINKHK